MYARVMWTAKSNRAAVETVMLAFWVASVALDPAVVFGQSSVSQPPTAYPQRWLRRPASWGLENAYRDHLSQWAGGSAEAAERWAEFEAMIVGNIGRVKVRPVFHETEAAQRAFRCIAAVEDNTFQWLLTYDPQLLLVVSKFHLDAYFDQVGRLELHWLGDQTWSLLEKLRRLYRDRRGASSEREEAELALLQTYVGGELTRLALINQTERARDSFGLAVRFEPEDAVSWYWLGFLDEKAGRLRRALRSYEWLEARAPEDFEIALRSSLVRIRLERPGQMNALVALAKSSAPDWIRILGYEEAARLRSKTSPAEASDLLREARRTFPDEPSLAVQLAALLPAGSAEGLDLLVTTLARSADSKSLEPSPRLLYEGARTGDLERRMDRFARFVDGKLPELVAALRQIEQDEERERTLDGSGRTLDRPRFKDCETFKPRPR